MFIREFRLSLAMGLTASFATGALAQNAAPTANPSGANPPAGPQPSPQPDQDGSQPTHDRRGGRILSLGRHALQRRYPRRHGAQNHHPGDNINEGAVPSYEQVNLGISHMFEDLLGGPTKVRFDVINLFDEEYLIRSMTGIGVFANEYAPRRSFYAGVSRTF